MALVAFVSSLALLFSVSTASAANRVDLQLSGKASRSLHAAGVKLTGAGAARVGKRSAQLPIQEATVGRSKAQLKLRGSIVFKREGKRVTFTKLRMSVGPQAKITGVVSGRRLALVQMRVPSTKRQLDPNSSGLSIRPVVAKLSPAAANLITRRLASKKVRSGKLGSLKAKVIGIDDVPAGGVVRWGFSEPIRRRVYEAGLDLSKPPIDMVDTGLCDLDLDPNPLRTPGCDPNLRSIPEAEIPSPTFYFAANSSKIKLAGESVVRAQGAMVLLDQAMGASLHIGNPVLTLGQGQAALSAFISLQPTTVESSIAPAEGRVALANFELAGNPVVKGRTVRWKTRAGSLTEAGAGLVGPFMDGESQLDPVVIEAER